MLPAILIVWPTVVVTVSSKVTATEVADVHADVVVVATAVVLVEPGGMHQLWRVISQGCSNR
jgi:hypothetical protein